MSIRDRYIKALTAQGEHELKNHKSRKYVVFTHHGFDGYYFIGKSGALRYGPTVTNSWPMSSAAKAKLLGSRADTMGADKAAALAKV